MSYIIIIHLYRKIKFLYILLFVSNNKTRVPAFSMVLPRLGVTFFSLLYNHCSALGSSLFVFFFKIKNSKNDVIYKYFKQHGKT